MYYYIFEQPKNRAATKTQEYVRDLLGVNSISGEYVTVSPARTTEELVEMGLDKNHSTIVAVGSDRHINRVAAKLHSNKKCVLGIIPINASFLILQLIGLEKEDFKEACLILKYRKIKEINMGFIEPNKYFLTQAEIQSPKSTLANITVINSDFDSYQSDISMTEIIISRNLFVFITDKNLGPKFWEKSWNWLVGKKIPDIESSMLRGKKIKIATSAPIPVIIDNEIVAKTPIVASLQSKALKIIAKPVRMKKEQERNNG